jgi:plastocyanin domain-containing protein
MSPQDWMLIVGAAGLIAVVNWYFLGDKGGAAVAAAAVGNTADITIRVEGGYTPNTIEVPLGSRVRLTFDRQEDNPCSEEVVIPDFGIRRDLPAFAKTPVEFTADSPGRHEFACGMGMLRGSILVK